MSDIENRLFRYFVALAEEQHFARAALRLRITPPTLTHQIKKLESWLGAKLFDRKGNRKVVVTEAGQRVLARVREILREVEETRAIARKAERGELGRLDIGFMTGVSFAGLLQTWIGAFQRANPAIEITMRKLVPVAQIGGMMRKELDAGFTRAPHKYPVALKGIEVYREPMVLALPHDHPLAVRKHISPAILRDETFVDRTPDFDVGFFGYTEAVASIGNFTPRVSKRDNDFSTLLTYVSLGYGIAVIPQIMNRMNFANVVFRDIAADPVPQTSIAFVYHNNPSPSGKLLIEHMQRHALPQHCPGGFPRIRVVS
jgi:DNA-binding transcriptional LysR family regulator